MKLPCLQCLVYPCCTDFCNEFFDYREDLKHNITKLTVKVYSKNGIKRKNIPAHIRKHFNSYAHKWNAMLPIKEKIISRYAP